MKTLLIATCAAVLCAACSTAAVQKSAEDTRQAMNRGDYKTAATDLNPVVSADSQDPGVYQEQAYAYFMAGENQRAIDDITKAIALEPQAGIYYLVRSFGYVRTGQFQLALADTNEAVSLAPNSAASYSQRGFVYMCMGDSGKAISDLSRAIKLDPNEAMYFVQRGFAYGLAHRYADAEADWQAAIRMRPNYGPPYTALGWMLATCPSDNIRDATKAVTYSERGAELGAPKMLAMLARSGVVPAKITITKKQYDPALAWSLDAFAAAYAESGDFERAVSVQKQAIAHNSAVPNPLATKERELLGLYQQKKPYRGDFSSLLSVLPWIELPS